MKNSFKFYLLFFSILPVGLAAQKTSDKVEISASSTFKDNSIWSLATDNQNRFYTVTTLRKDCNVNFHNEKLDIEKSIVAKLEYYYPKEYAFEKILGLSGELYILRSTLSKKKHRIFYSKVDKNSTTLTETTLFERTEEVAGETDIADYDIITSPDGKLFAIFCKNNFKDGTKNTHEVTVYDSVFNKIYSKSFTNFFNGQSIIDKEKYLSNNGDVVWKYDTKSKEGNEHYVAVITKNNSSPVHLKVKFKEKPIPDFSVCISNDGKCVLSGLYFEPQGNVPTGVYSINVDIEKGTLSEPQNTKLGFDLVNAPAKALAGTGMKGKNFGYIALPVIYHNDNTASVMFEQHMYATAQNSKGTDFTFYYKYDVIVARVDLNTGTIKWNTVIRKRQEVEAEEFSSVICTQKNNKLYMIYNDHIDNINSYDAANLKEMKSGTLGFKESGIVMEEIDESGKVSRELFYRDENNKDATILKRFSLNAKNGNLYLFLKHEQSGALKQDWTKNFSYLTVKIK